MANDTGTILDFPVTIDTPSLQELGNEPIPAEIVRDLLITRWADEPLTPRPEIHIMNDSTFSGQMDLRGTDWVIIEVIHIAESQRGYSYEFKDINVPVSIQLHTKVGRQRLYNVMKQIRDIIYAYQRVLNPFQQLYWDTFTDLSEGMNKYWKGECSLRLTSVGVPVFKGVTGGQGSPNLPVDQR